MMFYFSENFTYCHLCGDKNQGFQPQCLHELLAIDVCACSKDYLCNKVGLLVDFFKAILYADLFICLHTLAN